MAEIIKRIGPAGYWCRRCAHCNTVELGCIDDVPIYTCSNPYDGVEKKIPGDENITCTMFKLANEVPVYELKNKKAEQMTREKQKELEDKVDKYEDILVDICDALDPHFDFDKYDDDMEAFENFPSRILDLKKSCKDNFDECIRKMDIIDELKAENAKLKEEIKDNVEKYEKLLIDILKETYKHPQLFEHNIHAYELIPGHIKFLRNSFDTMCDKYDPIFEENAKLKEEIERLQNQVKNLQITNEESYKREEKLEDKVHKLERRLNEKICRMKQIDCELIMPLTRVLYPREAKIYKPYSEVINDIKDLKVYSEANETRYEDLKYWKERCHNAETDVTTLNSKVEVLDKRNTNQSVIIGEKGKEIENLAKKNRELQIRVNDLSFQHLEDTKKIVELKDDKYRILKENVCNRYGYPFYAARKAEDKIDHIQKEARKWKNKYKEAYDILETYFKYDLDGMEYDVSYDDISLKLRYSTPNGDKGNKYNALVSAYERLKKL